jgi:hypothetical protein
VEIVARVNSLSGRETPFHAGKLRCGPVPWDIAEHGPMPLFMAVIHLSRAWLFGRMKDERGRMSDEPKYRWESPQYDLAEARRLIETHGYHRRDEELTDAEAAARAW